MPDPVSIAPPHPTLDPESRAAAIDATLGTDAETPADVIWLLRYTTAKHNIQWPTLAEIRPTD